MRLSLRLTLSLVASVAVVTLGLALYQSHVERRGLRRELSRRALVVAESLEKSAGPPLGRHSLPELQRLVDQFASHERLAGAVIYDSLDRPLALTPGLASAMAADPQSNDRPEFFEFNGGMVHRASLPIFSDGTLLGRLDVFHDASYIDNQEASLVRRALAGVMIQTALIVGVTILILRWSLKGPLARLTKWLAEVRSGVTSDAPDLPEGEVFEPLKQEAARLATTLTAARAAAEEEARLRDAGESQWTNERLRAYIQSRMEGSRLFVVSNREPYEHVRRGGAIECTVPASGLVTALEPILRASSGTWVAQGTGDADREAVDKNDRVRVPPDRPEYSLRRVFLSPEEEEGFYLGFSNEGLWPLCHIAHTRPIFRAQDWVDYRAVNQKFATALLEEIADEDSPVVLVQDYHFALLPRLIKRARPDARVAIFWHIPWPNPEAFGICPWQSELLDGLLGADLIGFHAQAHCNNFLDTVDRVLESRIDRERFAVNRRGRHTYVRPFPISVPFTGDSSEPPSSLSPYLERAQLLRAEGVEAPMLGIGVDRVDYTKGIPERFRALELFFDNWPAYRGQFTFVQIGAPSRTHIRRYQELMDEVSAEAERINRRFRTNRWKPIVFLPRHHSHKQIVPYYRCADLCMVTSLHDGMNLVCKEFVAERPDEQGVLILSRFAGASHELTDALIVNPYDAEGLAESIHHALEMPPEERQARMSRMRSYVREHNIFRWAGSLIAELAAIRVTRENPARRRGKIAVAV